MRFGSIQFESKQTVIEYFTVLHRLFNFNFYNSFSSILLEKILKLKLREFNKFSRSHAVPQTWIHTWIFGHYTPCSFHFTTNCARAFPVSEILQGKQKSSLSIKKSPNSAFKAEADVTAFLSWWVCEDEWELFYNLEIWDLLPTQEENSVYGL